MGKKEIQDLETLSYENEELTVNEIMELYENTGIAFPCNDGEAKAEI